MTSTEFTAAVVPSAGSEDASALQSPSSPPTHVEGRPATRLSSPPKEKKRKMCSESPSKRAKRAGSDELIKSAEEPPEAPQTPKLGVSPELDTYPSPPEAQATAHDKKTWQGWCEIESDPTYFSAMIREMGVQGVTVREIFGLDEGTMETVPKPIYGLVLLFRYRALDEEAESKCPKNIWFANQMPNQNSCATLAMLNILMNTKNVDIGENLQQFKEFTSDFTPYLKGQEVAHFEFVKTIHNSFAKKMDMLQADVQLKNNYEKDAKKGRRGAGKEDTPPDDEEAHHFIAFLPIDGEVWKLDGMDKVPTLVGTYEEEVDWLDVAQPRLSEIMQSGGDNDYALFGLVQNPLVGLRDSLCSNVVTLDRVESRLTKIDEKWTEKVEDMGIDAPLRSPGILSGFGVTEDQFAATKIPENVEALIEGEGMDDLFARRLQLCIKNADLQGRILGEMASETEENEKADARRFDYGPVLQTWLRMLAENGYLEENL